MAISGLGFQGIVRGDDKMTEQFDNHNVNAMVCGLHQTIIHTINQKAKSEEQANEFLHTYYFATINALSLQSECKENGDTDIDKALGKTKRILAILSEQ